ncbi:choice-of-anchor Q domain-containing protein [Patescibacteria group bacterium]
MLNQIIAFLQNKKKYILILFTAILIITLSIFLLVIFNRASKEPLTSETGKDTTDQTTDQTLDTDLVNLLSNTVTLVNLSELPKDITDYSSYKSYYVSTTGSDSNDGSIDKPFASIIHALETANEGSVIFVREGTYKTNNITISKSDTVISAYQEEKVSLMREVVNDQWDMNEDLAFLIDGDIDNVIIDGFTLEDFEAGIIYGDIQTQENIIFKNINIKNANSGISNTYPTHTEYLVKNMLIKNVTMTNISGIGLQCGDEYNNCAKNVLIQNVEIYGIEDSTNHTGYDSLAMVESENILVIDSTFTNAPGDGLDFKASNVAVVNTTVENPNRNGIKFWHEGEIINCIVYGTGADASIVFGSDTEGSNFRIINSIVAQHLIDLPTRDRHAYAITIGYDESYSYNIELVNNIFYDMPGPIYINPESTIDVNNNMFYKFIHGDRFLVYGSDDLDNISSLNLKNYATNNQYTDPQFTDPISSNFSLQSTSPAIDSGMSENGIPYFDINWNERPGGSRLDIGSYEK